MRKPTVCAVLVIQEWIFTTSPDVTDCLLVCYFIYKLHLRLSIRCELWPARSGRLGVVLLCVQWAELTFQSGVSFLLVRHSGIGCQRPSTAAASSAGVATANTTEGERKTIKTTQQLPSSCLFKVNYEAVRKNRRFTVAPGGCNQPQKK